jgi:hypothetical protein
MLWIRKKTSLETHFQPASKATIIQMTFFNFFGPNESFGEGNIRLFNSFKLVVNVVHAFAGSWHGESRVIDSCVNVYALIPTALATLSTDKAVVELLPRYAASSA